MAKCGLLSFRHTKMVCHTTGKFRNMKQSSVFLMFSRVFQNISKCLKLNRPGLRPMSIVFRTGISTVLSLKF